MDDIIIERHDVVPIRKIVVDPMPLQNGSVVHPGAEYDECVFYDTIPDGNCFYRSLVLASPPGTALGDLTHVSLRQAVVQHLKKKETFFKRLLKPLLAPACKCISGSQRVGSAVCQVRV